ncbi:hypothetical protein CONCODRAFT_5275 [Conidiobolus coronatus NRRL 28638]|uniref:Uncharacterized protein n=1 Tax=Conidiobolus coronatus (strain ATCC 28846 / CBS 209.66 / NRRL 28638) TaxID=796925 RepID=A0A137PAB1_CONC2|nr:hypothetical protein CONCODRAFT_5275 [Conidiobolus coronatus NRRL 28638]|eukprot:KXN71949.1 hypothetical protein CONCODRAFT_5275 [Conidiobolus coronatus NRRL 28638]
MKLILLLVPILSLVSAAPIESGREPHKLDRRLFKGLFPALGKLVGGVLQLVLGYPPSADGPKPLINITTAGQRIFSPKTINNNLNLTVSNEDQ